MSDEEKKIHVYPGKEGDVVWDGRLCIHVGECGRSEGSLFESGRQPWCQPDVVQIGDVQEVVERCPTGALTLHRKDGAQERAAAENTAMIATHGPVYLKGDLDIDGATDDMESVRYRAALCRCGQSKNKPFCDNSHEAAGFKDRGAVGKKGEPLEALGGKLKVSPLKDGPVMVEGNLTIIAGSGRPAWQGTKVFLCRCGQSKNKPFCDGSHKAAGFTSE